MALFFYGKELVLVIVNGASNFDYDGTTLDEYEAILADFTSPSSSNDEESDIKTSKGSRSDRWDYHGVEYTTPLTFNFTIIRKDGEYFTVEQIRELKKWLCKDKYAWLTFEQDDMEDIFYYCKIKYDTTENVARENAGLTFKVICDAPYAWSEEIIKKIVTENNTASTYLSSVVDFDEYITRTSIKISVKSPGTVQIKNITDNNRIVQITECLTDEIIVIDGVKQMISSTKQSGVVVKWNKNFFNLLAGRNDITVTGNCAIEIRYRTPIRVGA